MPIPPHLHLLKMQRTSWREINMPTIIYTKKDLTKACSNTKSTLIKKLQKGTITSISKTAIYEDLAKRLNLKSARTLWDSNYKYREYLDSWYDNFCMDIEKISPKESPTTEPKILEINNNLDQNIQIKIKQQNQKIEDLERIIKTLRLENESLRLSKIERFGYIDKLHLLSELIDEVGIKELYELINKLYLVSIDSTTQ